MKNIYKLENLRAVINQDAVLKAIDCYENSPVYEEILKEYQSILPVAKECVEPVGIIGFGAMPNSIATKRYQAGTLVAYAVLSIGDKIRQRSTKAFQEGDYVRGMLYDAIADEALFSLEDKMLECLKNICRDRKIGVLERLEAPRDISIKAQREAWKYMNLKACLGIKITSGSMFDPIKTSCQIFVLTKDGSVFYANHDCHKCLNIKCKRRNCNIDE